MVITGIFPDAYDLLATFEASNLGFKVLFPGNITRGFSEEMEEAAKKMVSLYTGLVVDDFALLEEWRARFKERA